MIAGGYFITPHAVRQFIARIAPRLSYEQALDAIIRELIEHGSEERPLISACGTYVRTRGGQYPFRAVIIPADQSVVDMKDRPPRSMVVTILRSGR